MKRNESIIAILPRFLPDYVKNIFSFCYIKMRYPNLDFTHKTKLDLTHLDSYKFGANIRLVHARLGPNISIGDYTYISGPAYLCSLPECGITIGKFCSIAIGATFIVDNHSVNTPSTSDVSYFFGDVPKGKNGPITIGNDVWVGMNVIILPNVHVGDGAVIAAGAVVTKDVAPYSIVAGVPAREIKKRFPKQIIDWLIKVQWWNWSHDKIKHNREFFFCDLNNTPEYKSLIID
jgi:virginiamycin A acetyltransferase